MRRVTVIGLAGGPGKTARVPANGADLAVDHTDPGWPARITAREGEVAPGFELWPALDNRFDAADVRRRFDAMTDVLGLDRERARAWTYGRLPQNCLWDLEDGRPPEDRQLEIARRLSGRMP
ncbi:hypothetical protein A4U61_27590 [Streptomyces sp. H-KF8]|nr:hypothetical protein A4U61_27590 [Streptomyces sp. H-KF8]